MATPVTLPRHSWGLPHATRHALLVHGLGSNGALMWRFGTALGDDGWRADAVDLRGHGTAPRTLDYTIDAYATDLLHTGPADDEPWDLVIGHSLGGAAATVASAQAPAWTRRLVLVDPGILIGGRDREIVRNSQARAFAEPTADAVRAEHPDWHDNDIELKALSAAQASRWAVEQTTAQNDPWDVRDAASKLTVPTHIIASDPGVYSIFQGALADEVLANPVISMSVVLGAGHSPHRDRPDDTMRQLRDVLC
ncbi:alpha/beta fold hydrolase [Microbacterium sp.]|uniref:alpha/beta fold hydrolase n=1 Tax=Microbacterium sp. TaxID=51671 RepID=UPI003A855199